MLRSAQQMRCRSVRSFALQRPGQQYSAPYPVSDKVMLLTRQSPCFDAH